MVRAVSPAVGDLVNYFHTNRWRPAKVTARTSDTVVSVRVLGSTETHASISKSYARPKVDNTWRPR